MARAAFLESEASPDLQMQSMILLLKPDEEQQAALEAFIEAQHDPASPLYQQWLSPEEFGQRFGVAREDIDKVVGWLQSQGFVVEDVPAGGRSIVFSGTASRVQSAFGTQMQRYSVNGQLHYANADDPSIPEALGVVVDGVVSMHDFRRAPMHGALAAPAAADPLFTSGASHYLSPADFATIYNVSPLYSSGVDGTGQTIAIVGRSNIHMSDVQAFRQRFGLPTNNPIVVVNGTDPGVSDSNEEAEALLDVQWSGAVAPKATVKFVVSASTSTTDGVDLSAQYIVSNNVAPVMSVSFGSCEIAMGATERNFYNSLWQQAAAQGITVFVASGDSGAAGCDPSGASTGTRGRGVNGLCSTPYSVCVGGTGLGSTNWSASNDSSSLKSALGYVPESAWNDSGAKGGSGLASTGGGPSAYFVKPSWQSGAGVPADGKRDTPDVSLNASGRSGYLLYIGGQMMVIGGTSASSPAFAGLMALVNQKTGQTQGNANTRFYALAALQKAGGPAFFHDITTGDNTVPGVTGFAATAGYDLATGLGSVNADVLANHWKDDTGAAQSVLTVTAPTVVTVVKGSNATGAIQVGLSGASDCNVTLSASGAPAGVTADFSSSTVCAPGSSTLQIAADANMTAGNYKMSVAAIAGALTKTAAITLTVKDPPSFTLTSTTTAVTLPQKFNRTAAFALRAVSGFASAISLSVSGLPSGVTGTFAPSSIASPGNGTSTLTLAANSTVQTGTYSVEVTATGGSLAKTLTFTLTVTDDPDCTLTATPTDVSFAAGTPGKVTISCTSVEGGLATPMALKISALPTGVTGVFAPVSLVPGKTTAVLTLNSLETATVGDVTLTVTATANLTSPTTVLTRTVQIPVSVKAANTFRISATAASATVMQGESTDISLTSTHSGEFQSAVAWTVAGAPAGTTAVFSSATIAAPGDGTTKLTITAGKETVPGTYRLVATAKGGTVTRTQLISLVITPSPSFTLSQTLATVTVAETGRASVTVLTSKLVGGFNAAVALAVPTGLPSGVTAAFTPSSIAAPGAGSSVLTFTADATAPVGKYTVAVTATSGDVKKTVNLVLTVTPPPTFNLASSVAKVTALAGTSTTIRVASSVLYGFTGSVALSAGTLPNGFNVTFTPATIAATGSSAVVIQTTASMTSGNYTITLTGTSGQTTKSVTIPVSVGKFGISPSTSTATVARGSSTTLTVRTTNENAFTGTVVLSAPNLPAGIAAVFTPAVVAVPSGSSTLKLTAAAGLAPGSKTITVRGIIQGVLKEETIALTVQ